MSSCSSSSSGSGSVCCSPVSSLSQLFNRLDSAAEFMMVHRDFHAAFDTCSRGLESLASTDSEDNRFLKWSHFTGALCWSLMLSLTLCFCVSVCRCGELKAAFCIIGIQALAELNQWGDVFSWALQQYEHLENIPAKIMQMWWEDLWYLLAYWIDFGLLVDRKVPKCFDMVLNVSMYHQNSSHCPKIYFYVKTHVQTDV